ncbi:hypothetical protein Ddye_014109 [Dipteronia dyeriana]|uniref:Disease resistance R13L4/SHOC-2-like LRR domain-containing protein n=1 Tax=Dipteronia dyeriana TaxID=168575 RepID=A0AAE0CKU8_9ROSI|nr:hypothetical protein Ddye_014109 [Dipteronia dyeriana]
MIHLKYLGFKGKLLGKVFSFNHLTESKRIDRSLISNLRRLQTLVVDNLNRAVKFELPAKVSRLQELKHLIGYFSYRPESIVNLTKLQTLRTVNIRSWERTNTEKLVNLRELWVAGYMHSKVFSFNSKVFSFNSKVNNAIP